MYIYRGYLTGRGVYTEALITKVDDRQKGAYAFLIRASEARKLARVGSAGRHAYLNVMPNEARVIHRGLPPEHCKTRHIYSTNNGQ